MNKKMMEVEVDGKIEERSVDYSMYRGKDEDGRAKFVDYPILMPQEHFYESERGLKVFTSSVRWQNIKYFLLSACLSVIFRMKIDLKLLLIFTLLISLCWAVLLRNNDNHNSNYYTTTGESNGNFFGEKVVVKKTDIESLVVGDFIVFTKDEDTILHPITNIIRLEDEIIGFETKGLENDIKDPIVLPDKIIGKAYRVLENGLIEKDTKSPK